MDSKKSEEQNDNTRSRNMETLSKSFHWRTKGMRGFHSPLGTCWDGSHSTALLKSPVCTVRLPKMAILLLSAHPLLYQCLLHLHPTHMTDLRTYFSQAPASDSSCQRDVEGACPSASFPDNRWAILTSIPPITGCPPPHPPGATTATMACLLSTEHSGVSL